MIADATGDSRIIEFIDGHIRVSPSEYPSWHLSTNSVVWRKSESEKDARCHRYERGSSMAEQLNGTFLERDAVEITKSMSAKGWTMWTSVYELKNKKFLHFYRAQPNIIYRDQIA